MSKDASSKFFALRESGFDARYLKGGHYAWKALGAPTKRHVPA